MQGSFRSAPVHYFGRFGMDFGWIFYEFEWILASLFTDFGYVSAAPFAECQRRLPRNEITENFKNMQILAGICKSQTQTKTHKSELRSGICKLQNAISYNQNAHLQNRGRRCSRRQAHSDQLFGFNARDALPLSLLRSKQSRRTTLLIVGGTPRREPLFNNQFYHNVLKPPKCLYIQHFGAFSTFCILLHFLPSSSSFFLIVLSVNVSDAAFT